MAKILIVDDSKVIRDLLTEFLGELSYQVDSAEDGAKGLKMASDGGYDLCICDVHLPKLNGYQILTELGEARGKMQFIFTDSLPDELADQIRKTTGFACLGKPFDLHQLTEIITQSLEKIHT
ncbi:MAG: response regulator [candidate division Zixibacteria bacterium]|nr:response regulator [candidate division Zixibacteria bacterium]